MLEYDEDRLPAPPRTGPSVGVLDHDRAAGAIAEFKRELMARNEASPLFGNARGDALAAILGNIEQTMFGEPLYRTREEKAAHLLYFVVKDHPFTDGNKRIGSLLFLLYLKQEAVEHRLNPQGANRADPADRRMRASRKGPHDSADRQPAGPPSRMIRGGRIPGPARESEIERGALPESRSLRCRAPHSVSGMMSALSGPPAFAADD